MDGQVKRVHENLKQLTFTKTGDTHHSLHVRIQTPDGVDIGLWLDRWQTVDVISWLHGLISCDRMSIPNLPTILDIVEEGINGEKEKCRGYAELWLERLQADGETRTAETLQRILEGRKGQVIHLVQDTE